MCVCTENRRKIYSLTFQNEQTSFYASRMMCPIRYEYDIISPSTFKDAIIKNINDMVRQ